MPGMILLVYSLTVFFSAILLFALQPLFSRMVLPLLGGAPSVWNTSLVFYQATLLAGYVYAHASTRILGVRRQAFVHVLLLVSPLLVLPIQIPPTWTPPTEGSPVPWLLALLSTTVGLPFFAVSTTAPLLQRWFAVTGHPSAGDPYFLYAASNAGSFLALLSYPLIVEPLLPLTLQAHWWTFGYVVFAVLVTASALAVVRSSTHADAGAAVVIEPTTTRDWLVRRGRWLALSLIPSSLMLAVTSHISINVAAIPLLWIVPLSLYLLTFVLVFARRPPPHRLFLRMLPITALTVTFTFAFKATEPLGFMIALHLVMLFVASMVCHGELARDRPSPRGLTEFYLWMAAGGVLGGAFNALIAPLVFRSVVEYPLIVVATLLIAPLGKLKDAASVASNWGAVRAVSGRLGSARLLDVVLPVAIGALSIALVFGLSDTMLTPRTKYLIAFGLPGLLAFGFSRRPLRFALAMGIIIIVSARYGQSPGRILHSERTFFGIHRVSVDENETYRQMLHGRTMHGRQSLDPARRTEPIGYFSTSGPAGQILQSIRDRRPARIAVIGLGSGTLAAHAVQGESWTFFEIDPAVERIARDSLWFTYLADSPGTIQVVLGDGRRSLAATTARYDLIVVDAYSSEAIPLHLLSREALRLYLARLAPRGLLALHISNEHFDLVPVVAALARDGGLAHRIRPADKSGPEEFVHGNAPSEWAVIAREPGDLGHLATDPRWTEAPQTDGIVWTDDHSDVLAALR
jgi:spermidine synthase